MRDYREYMDRARHARSSEECMHYMELAQRERMLAYDPLRSRSPPGPPPFPSSYKWEGYDFGPPLKKEPKVKQPEQTTETQQKGTTSVNYSTAIMLINANVRAVKCSYEPAGVTKPIESFIYKTLDTSIKVGDYVVVPTDTRWKMTVNRVEEVDVDVDFDSSFQVKWVLARVDQDEVQRLETEEAKAIQIIKKAENRKKREDIRANLDALKTEELSTLSIAQAGTPPAIEAVA